MIFTSAVLSVTLLGGAGGSGTPPPSPHETPRPIHSLSRAIKATATREVVTKAVIKFYLRLNAGRVVVTIDSEAEDAHIDAAWPHDPQAMREALDAIEERGYALIPEEDSPAEVLGGGMVRVWLMER